jgi:hypothetical protein
LRVKATPTLRDCSALEDEEEEEEEEVDALAVVEGLKRRRNCKSHVRENTVILAKRGLREKMSRSNAKKRVRCGLNFGPGMSKIIKNLTILLPQKYNYN